jgi:uncharacterized protein (TIGR02246 family)
LRAGDALIDLVTLDGELGKAGGAPPAAQGRNLDHFCLRIEPFDETAIRAHLRQHGVQAGPVQPRYGAQGEGPSLYVADPDGNVVELRGKGAGREHAVPTDEEQIRAMVQTWLGATQAGDLDTVLGLMTDDVVFLLPGREPMGKAQFAALSRVPADAPRPTINSVSDIREIQVSGDMAWLWSRLSVTVAPAGAAQPIERAGHTLTVLRRVNGKWLLARDANLLSPVLRT